MSLNLGTMYAALTLDPSNFNKTLNGLPDEAQAVFDKVKGIIGRAFSFDEVIRFGKKSLDAFIQQENAVNAYSAALQNLGLEYQSRTREANAFASEMQKITKYGDEVTMSAMSQGIKLGIDPSQIQQATKAAMVMAEKYGMDLPAAMMLLGRASQGQTQMLTRYGIVLDETLSSEEKFNKLLKLGADEFGLVTAAAQTTEGQLAQAMNAVGDTMELVGEKIAEFILPLVNTVGSIATAFNTASPGMQTFITTAAVMAGTVMLLRSNIGKLANKMLVNLARGLSTSVIGMFRAVKSSIAMNGGFKAAFLGIKTGAKTAALAMKGFFASMGPIGWAILAVETLTAVLSLMGDSAEEAASLRNDTAQYAYENAKKAADQEQQNYETMLKNIELLKELQLQEELTTEQHQSATDAIKTLVAANTEFAGAIRFVNSELAIEEEKLDRIIRKQAERLKDAKTKEINAQNRILKAKSLDFQDTQDWGLWADTMRAAISTNGKLSREKIEAILETSQIGDVQLNKKQRDALQALYTELIKFEKLKEERRNIDKKVEKDILETKKKQEAKLQELRKKNFEEYQKYERKKKQMEYDKMSNSDKLTVTNKEIASVNYKLAAIQQGGVTDKEYQKYIKLCEQQLDLVKRQKDLEEKVSAERKKQADEAEREAKAKAQTEEEDKRFLDDANAKYTGITHDVEKRKAQEETERQFRQLMNIGTGQESEAFRFAGNMVFGLQNKIADNDKVFQKAQEEAMADGTLDDQEKAYINSLLDARKSLQSELETWEGNMQEANTVDESATQEATEAVGAWSAEVMNAQLGGPRSTEKLIEKNTREQVRLTRDMLATMTNTETYAE